MFDLPDQPDQLDHLLATLADRGVVMRVEDGRLQIDAPAGLFTPELTAEIKRHRDEIIRRLEAAQANDGPRWEDCVDPPEPCPRCDGLMCWWDLLGGLHCLNCNPPIPARRLAADAARIRNNTRRNKAAVDAVAVVIILPGVV